MAVTSGVHGGVRHGLNTRRVRAQCNERYLSWDQSAQLKLLKLVLAEKLG